MSDAPHWLDQHKPLTDAERDTLLRLAKKGVHVDAIAAETGIPVVRVRGLLMGGYAAPVAKRETPYRPKRWGR
jgi:predicted RNase H-like nuclease (RuvC/YqgF family)